MPVRAVRCCAHFLLRVLMIVAIVVPFGPPAAHTQVISTGSVRGRVLTVDGAPITGALVEFVGRTDSARTTSTGAFFFRSVPVGAHVLRIRAIGHAQKSQPIRVDSDSGWVGNIVLDRIPQPLPEVEVTAGGKPLEYANTTQYDDFFRRRSLGFGTFRTRDDIERMGTIDVASLLQGIPGVNISSTHSPFGGPEIRMRIARCPGPKVAIYINGKQVANFDGFTNEDLGDILTSLSLVDVVFVEFYRGPGQIPADLDANNACAALVIWTR